jgi:gliding motility-associated-like protein
MKPFLRLIFFALPAFCTGSFCWGQLQVTNSNSALALAQKIAGEGVTISNVTLTGGPNAKGFFVNQGNTNIGIDSGVVLTTGRAASTPSLPGINGNGTTPAWLALADNMLSLPGDINLANALGLPVSNTKDACILEFDFVPIGDTIRFNYVFSSEEYTPEFVCEFNDAFAFFISGPGITGLKNIALIPGTNIPVSIFNVNNVQDPPDALCPNNIQYYIDNTSNVYFTHDGHTTVLTAISEVQPCQTYHLKLVIVDVDDNQYDSAVFLEAGSLRSEPLRIDGHTPINDLNLPYLAEGCVPGAIHVIRSRKKPYAQTINLVYGGSATNGVDVALLPATATIPANDSVVVIPIVALADFVPEGIEVLKIYIRISCATVFSDSINIELRDVDLLSITPEDSVRICRNSSVQFTAVDGYLNYAWTNGSSLSNNNISNPIATPGSAVTNYICTATIGNCIARDSVLVKWKTISLVSKTDVLCKNGTTGAITIAGTGWQAAVSYAINNGAYQAGNTFTGLPVGTHWVKMKDASGCVDSIPVTLIQSSPDIVISTNSVPATCSVTPDGTIEVIASGGNGHYTFSTTGTTWQNNNILTVAEGTYTVYVKDDNGCTETKSPIVVPKINTVTVDAEPDTFMCEGTSYTITATSNAGNINWMPTTALTNTTTLTPTANPTNPTKYYVTATFGTCNRTDSVMLNVWAAPRANAGPDIPICYGITAQLNGSGGTEYQWTSAPTFVSATNISNPIVKPPVTTTYYLHVKDIHGCNSLQQDDVTVKVTPSVKMFAGRDTIVAINQPLQLNAIELNNSGVNKWDWAATSFLNNPFIANPVAVFTSPVTLAPYEYIYTITGTTPEGCQGSDSIKIKVYKGPQIYVPTGFTPNGDGKNDFLIPLPVGLRELTFFRVFNRWGQMIFHTQNPSKGWDGRIMGVDQPTSVYIWMAEGIDYTGKIVSRKGTSTLIR